MPRAHRKKSHGKHRRPRSLAVTWRTTGGVVVGAAVLGTAAATAQASVLPFGPAPVRSAAAADLAPGLTAPGAPSSRPSGHKPASAAPKAPKRERSARPSPRATGEPSGEAAAKSRPTAAQAIRLARSQVGIEEDGAGETKFQEWYMSTSRARETLARDGGSLDGYSDANWCDMFVSWVGEQIGFGDQIGSDAWTIAHARWFAEHGRWGTEPRPGAIVFYAWDGGKSFDDIQHVGMVVEEIDDGTIEAVEGNTDNAVRVKERSKDSVVGYGYPDYRS
ncbi:CHAP domain-containing protein [Actinomadura sp. WMMA1423]|uniref:CHAP domain-containing protein n=1 Tax=Actinomadura sp. WMMA1423 TaxID=2591108 RepID=UPI0011478990|nr:CHAP domain-containing protein [Actinomadura sp. WMMA1423]